VRLQGDEETVFLAFPGRRTMIDLFWPGDARAGELMTKPRSGGLPWSGSSSPGTQSWPTPRSHPGSNCPLSPSSQPYPIMSWAELAESAESGGNPVIPLLVLLRAKTRSRCARLRARGCTWGSPARTPLDTALGPAAARHALGGAGRESVFAGAGPS
jgi:hypothetical protein